ncbi:hypothetical protein SRRS_03150 [Sporomusa rhizae]|uniref:Yip1 family protein n=1 Tax=Sporomusa rhizae TaxID=357999 RepID=UPI003529E45C
MGSFLETIYDVLFKPTAAMHYIAEKKLTGQALTMFVISMLVPVLAVYISIKDLPGVPAFGILFVLNIIGSFFSWVLGAAVLSFVAELFGGKGTAVGLFAAMGFSHLPRVAAIPLWVIAALMPGGIRGLLLGIVGLIVFIWTLTLQVAALRGAHGLSATKAVLVLIAPMLAIIGGVTALIIFLSTSLMQLPFAF